MAECKELNLAVVAGRHEIPQATDVAVFDEIPAEYITKPFALYVKARIALAAKLQGDPTHWCCVDEDQWGTEIYQACGVRLNLYVTGLTVALVAVLNACKDLGIADVELYHYDRNTSKYYSQKVL